MMTDKERDRELLLALADCVQFTGAAGTVAARRVRELALEIRAEQAAAAEPKKDDKA